MKSRAETEEHHVQLVKVADGIYDRHTLNSPPSLQALKLQDLLMKNAGGRIVGPSSDRGCRIADQMNTIRQKRDKQRRQESEAHHTPASMHYLTEEEKLARADEITVIAF